MKETVGSEEQIALQIVTGYNNIGTDRRNDADNGKKKSCITIISCAWWLVCMVINVLILFVFPVLNSYSYRNTYIDYPVTIVYGFDKWWMIDEFELDDYSGLADADEIEMYATVCNGNYAASADDQMTYTPRDFCVLEKTGEFYYWLLITSVILQFIVVIINFKCGNYYLIKSICNNERINYLLACAIGFISVFLTLIGYLNWKLNSIDTIYDITKDCEYCGPVRRRTLEMESEDDDTYYGYNYGFNYNISNINSTIGYTTTRRYYNWCCEAICSSCNASVKDEFANIAVLVSICVNVLMFLFLTWYTKK